MIHQIFLKKCQVPVGTIPEVEVANPLEKKKKISTLCTFEISKQKGNHQATHHAIRHH